MATIITLDIEQAAKKPGKRLVVRPGDTVSEGARDLAARLGVELATSHPTRPAATPNTTAPIVVTVPRPSTVATLQPAPASQSPARNGHHSTTPLQTEALRPTIISLDVEQAAKQSARRLIVRPGSVVSADARELAARLGVTLVEQGAPATNGTTTPTTATIAGTPPAGTSLQSPAGTGTLAPVAPVRPVRPAVTQQPAIAPLQPVAPGAPAANASPRLDVAPLARVQPVTTTPLGTTTRLAAMTVARPITFSELRAMTGGSIPVLRVPAAGTAPTPTPQPPKSPTLQIARVQPIPPPSGPAGVVIGALSPSQPAATVPLVAPSAPIVPVSPIVPVTPVIPVPTPVVAVTPIPASPVPERPAPSPVLQQGNIPVVTPLTQTPTRASTPAVPSFQPAASQPAIHPLDEPLEEESLLISGTPPVVTPLAGSAGDIPRSVIVQNQAVVPPPGGKAPPVVAPLTAPPGGQQPPVIAPLAAPPTAPVREPAWKRRRARAATASPGAAVLLGLTIQSKDVQKAADDGLRVVRIPADAYVTRAALHVADLANIAIVPDATLLSGSPPAGSAVLNPLSTTPWTTRTGPGVFYMNAQPIGGDKDPGTLRLDDD